RNPIFFVQAEDGIRDWSVTGVQTCALPIYPRLRTDRKTDDVDPDSYRVAKEWFSGSALDDTKRRAPVVKLPREFRSTVELAQIEIGRASCRERGESVGAAGRWDKKR